MSKDKYNTNDGTKGRGGACERDDIAASEYEEERALGQASNVAGLAQRKLAVVSATNDIYQDLITKYRHETNSIDKEIHLLEQMTHSNQISVVKFKDMLISLQERSSILDENYLTKKNLMDVKKKNEIFFQLNRDSIDVFDKKATTYKDVYKRMPLMKLKTSTFKEANLLEYELMKLDNDIENTKKALKTRNEIKKKQYQSLIVEFATFIMKDSKEFKKTLADLQVMTEESMRLNKKLRKEKEDLEKALTKSNEKRNSSGISFNCQLPTLNFEDPLIPILQLSAHNREDNFSNVSEQEIENAAEKSYNNTEEKTQESQILIKLEPSPEKTDTIEQEIENVAEKTYDNKIEQAQESQILIEFEQFPEKNDPIEQDVEMKVDVQSDVNKESRKIKIISNDILRPEETAQILQKIKRVKTNHTEILGPTNLIECTMLPVVQPNTNNEILNIVNLTDNSVEYTQPFVSAENNENVPETMETDALTDRITETSYDLNAEYPNSNDGNNYFSAKSMTNVSSSESNDLVDYNPFESFAALLKTKEFEEIFPVKSPILEFVNIDNENPPAGPSKQEEQQQGDTTNEKKEDDFSFTFSRKNTKKSTGFFSSLF